MIPLLILLLSIAPQDRASKLYDRMVFPPKDELERWEGRSDVHRRVVAKMLSKKAWLAAIRNVEDELGPLPDDMVVKVELAEWVGSHPAIGNAIGSNGSVKINMRRLVEYQDTIDRLEKQKRDLAKKGKRLIFKVPPIKFERIIHHEMTHVFQREVNTPDWFHEGLASWIGNDSNYLYAFGVARKKVGDVDGELEEGDDAYPRGMLFFQWLDSRIRKKGMRALGKAIYEEGKPWKEALVEAAGKEWPELVAAERKWSAKRIRRYQR